MMKLLSALVVIGTFIVVVYADGSYQGSGYQRSGYRSSGYQAGSGYRGNAGYRGSGYRVGGYHGSGYRGGSYHQGSGRFHQGGGYGYKKVTCKKLAAPANGNVKLSGIRPGDKATYSCNTGFVLVGPVSQRKCLSNGQWSAEAPICKRINCGPLPDIANGAVSISPDTRLGSTATYTCTEGFNLVGSNTRRCQASGSWSGEEPSCQPVDCGPLSNPSNGWVHIAPNTKLGGVALYRCKLGYQLTSGDTLTCLSSGQYSQAPPSCAPISCGPPPAANPNGQIVSSQGTSLGDQTTYSCSSGFFLVGSATIYCQNDKTYSDAAPECRPVDCGAPDPADPNGSLNVDSTTFQSQATYSCNAGHILVGQAVATCQANGEWSSEAPVCQPVDCGKLPAPKNGAVSLYPGTTLSSTATFICRKGFRLVGSKVRSCQTNGKWSGVQPVCKRISCPKVAAPQFGKVFISGNYPGDRLHYSCAYGFKLSGPSRRICLHTGVWSGKAAVCVKDRSYGHDFGYNSHSKKPYDDDGHY